MREAQVSRSALLKWLLIGAGWTLFAFFFASEVLVRGAYAGRPLEIWRALSGWLICALLWLIATPLILWLARRFPLERPRWLTSTLFHLAAGSLLSLLLLALYALITSTAGLDPASQGFSTSFRNQIAWSFHSQFLTYWMVIGLSNGFDYYRKYRERELRASQLETKLAQAQLEALRMQLHPHFLFNTLNSISVLMGEDVSASRRMLSRLGDLLRLSLENSGAHQVSLREELDFLRNYLEIEQTRFHDRLTVQIDIEPDVLDAQVPNLILQPLVENAIRHGIASQAESGLIQIRAARNKRRRSVAGARQRSRASVAFAGNAEKGNRPREYSGPSGTTLRKRSHS
jgi:two-component system, LytTR family, sensor kinase